MPADRTAEERAREIGEAIAKKADDERHNQGMFQHVTEFATPLIAAAIASAVEAEREECADLVERVARLHAEGWYKNPGVKPEDCGIAASNTGFYAAQAIRARKGGAAE